MTASSAATATHRRIHWARLPEAGLSMGLWFLYAWHKVFGRGLYRLLMWPVAWYFVCLRRIARRASIDYLRRVGEIRRGDGGFAAWRAAARHVHRFADALLDKALVWTGGLDLRAVRVEVDPRFDGDLEAGRGGVMVVAHFGNLEVLRAMGERAKKLRLHILVHTKHAERFNRMLERMNPASTERLLQVTELDTATIAYLAQRVEAGDFVVIAGDRVPATSERTIDVPFLGADAPLPVGPWVLAAALHCPVYWLACFQEDAKRADATAVTEAGERRAHAGYTLVCEQLRARVDLPRPQRTEALRAVMTDYAACLERACRRAPYAWFNFFPYWHDSR